MARMTKTIAGLIRTADALHARYTLNSAGDFEIFDGSDNVILRAFIWINPRTSRMRTEIWTTGLGNLKTQTVNLAQARAFIYAWPQPLMKAVAKVPTHEESVETHVAGAGEFPGGGAIRYVVARFQMDGGDIRRAHCILQEGYSTEADLPAMLALEFMGSLDQAHAVTVLDVLPAGH